MSTTSAVPVLTFVRILNASRERVFDAWTKPELVVRWFGPTMDSKVTAEIDLRVGGRYAFHIESPMGRRTAYGEYTEVDPPARLGLTWQLSGLDEASRSVITVDFKELSGDKTEITVVHSQILSDEMRNGNMMGWNGGLNKLELLFDPNAKVDMTNTFDCQH